MMLDEQWRAPGWGQPMSHEVRVVARVKVDDDLSFRVRSIGLQGGYCFVEPAARAKLSEIAQWGGQLQGRLLQQSRTCL
jgi:hypothetical protein